MPKPAGIATQDIALERCARHGFLDRPATSVVDAVRLTTALQAQDAAAARLGVRSRSSVLTEQDVQRAVDTERTVVRSWLMRATIHLVTADDLRWLTALIGPTFARKFAKRWRDMGLTPRLLERTAAALPEVLRDGPLPLPEIMSRIAAAGLRVPSADPQTPYHVMLHASGLGLVCRGPEQGRTATFALIDQWLPQAPPGPSGDDALAALARRFFTAFGPATAADFSAWSGLPSSRALSLVRDELSEVPLDGRTGFRLGAVPPPQHGVRLLSAFDNYLVGYRDRSLIIDAEHRPAVYVGGVIKPTVLIDGRVGGSWRLTRTARGASVSVAPFAPLTRATRAAVDAEVADIGRFLATPITLD